MRKSVTKRIQLTKTGKIRRRAVALGHNKNNKSSLQKLRKKKNRDLYMKNKTIKKYL